MNQETALNIVIGVAKRSPEFTQQCRSTKALKQFEQALRVCQTLSDNRAAKRSWRESCGHRPAVITPARGPVILRILNDNDLRDLDSQNVRVSECCGVTTEMAEEIGICPECREHCEFVSQNATAQASADTHPTKTP